MIQVGGFFVSFFLSRTLDILALSESIRELSVSARRVRTAMWSALQSTVHMEVDFSLATGQKQLEDQHLLRGKSDEDDN